MLHVTVGPPSDTTIGRHRADLLAAPARAAEPVPNPRSDSEAPSGDNRSMGFNPERVQRRSRWDYVFVASAIVVSAALLLWALLG